MEVAKKRRMDRIKFLLIFIFIILIIGSSAFRTQISFSDLWQGFPKIWETFIGMFPPDWSYFSYITGPMFDTIRIAILGTTFGGILSIPIVLLSSRNVTRSPILFYPARFILNLIRTIPELLLAALFVPIFGIGPTAGIFAITVFSLGVIAKLAYEAVEAIDPGPLEAMTAVGANKIQWIFFGVVPQVAAYYMSYFLYSFEINVRAAVILGYVGAGGIGLILDNVLTSFQYHRVISIIIYTLVVVIIIDFLSNKIREKLL
ncbi:phosphonate ABC transporter, permease protein PhnE [Camelliibacillus cellulosilyticus]|uniref:Phosphonate ABC transporter, permease protein PhnE n=1 Tax=Camelliibacillus cellulosilyticus TaxID=2174486 RepID=A0ABV9GQT8_9BACL